MGKVKNKRILAFCMALVMCVLPFASNYVKAEDEDTEYTVTLTDVENGEIKFYDSDTDQTFDDSKRVYEANSNVEVLFVPDEDCEVSAIKIYDTDGNLLDQKNTTDEEFSFTMPSMDIVVGGVIISTKTHTTEILVGTEDISIFREGDNVVSEYNGVYLLKFETECNIMI